MALPDLQATIHALEVHRNGYGIRHDQIDDAITLLRTLPKAINALKVCVVQGEAATYAWGRTDWTGFTSDLRNMIENDLPAVPTPEILTIRKEQS
jgi:hypothetical protein